MNVKDTNQMLESEKAKKLFTALYGENAVKENIERYQSLVMNFQKKFQNLRIRLQKPDNQDLDDSKMEKFKGTK